MESSSSDDDEFFDAHDEFYNSNADDTPVASPQSSHVPQSAGTVAGATAADHEANKGADSAHSAHSNTTGAEAQLEHHDNNAHAATGHAQRVNDAHASGHESSGNDSEDSMSSRKALRKSLSMPAQVIKDELEEIDDEQESALYTHEEDEGDDGATQKRLGDERNVEDEDGRQRTGSDAEDSVNADTGDDLAAAQDVDDDGDDGGDDEGETRTNETAKGNRLPTTAVTTTSTVAVTPVVSVSSPDDASSIGDCDSKRSSDHSDVKQADDSTVASSETGGDEMVAFEGPVIRNLDTGEIISLEQLEQLPVTTFDPLTLHLRERDPSLAAEAGGSSSSSKAATTSSVTTETASADGGKKKKTSGKKRWFKSGIFKRDSSSGSSSNPREERARESVQHTLNSSGVSIRSDGSGVEGPEGCEEVLVHKKSIQDFTRVHRVQEMSAHVGAVWCMKVSPCGRFLATAGQNMDLKVWVLCSAPEAKGLCRDAKETDVYAPIPYRTFYGHKADILDLAWSPNSHRLLSASMDKSVILWNVTDDMRESVYRHVECVTCVSFHPADKSLFLTGSLDGKLRIWNLNTGKPEHYVDTKEYITSAEFSPDGGQVWVGSYSGKCLVFALEDKLVHVCRIYVRSTRGKNSKGAKITGIVVSPDKEHVLITSNDSRIRMYTIHDQAFVCKYKGFTNAVSQIKASFSHEGNFIICGSEDRQVYIWNTQNAHYVDNMAKMFSQYSRKDRNDAYESFTASDSIVTSCTCLKLSIDGKQRNADTPFGQLIATADLKGVLRVFHNDGRPVLLSS